MYFIYMIKWIYQAMLVPFPIVTSAKSYGLVTVFDLFMFTVYLGVAFVLIRFIITDNLSFKVGNEDISYSSRSAIFKGLKSIKKAKSNDKESDD